MARVFQGRASLRNFRQAPQEWRIEIENEKIEDKRPRKERQRRAESCPAGCFASFDEYVQALRHDFHAWTRLLRIRSERKEISRFSRRDCRERAGIFISGPRAHDPARSGARGSRLEPVSQSFSGAASRKTRQMVAHGPRIFQQ